jgi:superfamily II DNA or RNA helicase
MELGIYEALVTRLITSKINNTSKDSFEFKFSKLDKEEASKVLSQHIGNSIKHALSQIKGENKIELQIEIANKIILLLKNELGLISIEDDLIEYEGKILKAIFSKINSNYADTDLRLKEITPYTRLNQSELFTGGNNGISLVSELKKEILSSDRIDLLVSFIKFTGIRILENELHEFTRNGGKLRVITTSYMGASDFEAIQLLSKLENTEIKVSYNTGNERLHAKAYLFFRNSGFHTGYIGSSNFSRSALTDGLEWNIKITSNEINHIIDKFQKTFNSYWENNEFESYDNNKDVEKLKSALNSGKIYKPETSSISYFDIKPYNYQKEVLEKLQVERTIHNRYRNLVVAATGTGKTVISAFDFKNYITSNPNAKLLFVAHRKEILEQSINTFRGILKNNNFGELFVDGIQPKNYEQIFTTTLTLKNRLAELKLTKDYFDFIIIDEVHHVSASSYRYIIEYFTPNILLGLTATPERMDGENILVDFCDRIAAEIRLPEAIEKGLLSPFQYFGISDSVDLSNVKWERGKYLTNELSALFTSNEKRVSEIIYNLEHYTKDINDLRAICFCVDIEHAKFMSRKFKEANLKSNYLVAENSSYRTEIRKQLENKEINYLFVVDIFNEGVDIPNIDTVLFLRPTESLTVFLQQLGRGLRLAENKECLTVLDFVSNARPEYDFEGKLRSLIGKTTTSVLKEVEDNFPHLPIGCTIILEKKAKEIILSNIKNATSPRKNNIINRIINFEHQTTLELNLSNFIKITHLPLQLIYNYGGWKRLCQLAGKHSDFTTVNETVIISAIKKKWLSTQSTTYFKFILKLAKINFKCDISNFDEIERKMLLMLHFDIWQNHNTSNSLKDSIEKIGENEILVHEIIEIVELLINNIDFLEQPIQLPYKQPISLHSRHTRDQILAAFGFSTFENKSSNREGIAFSRELNTELLFIDLVKSEEDFSPTTMYNDYAISEKLFHWQSQNKTREDSGVGLTYKNHSANEKIILLFIRETANDEFNNTNGYVFAGQANFVNSNGSKPMNITWELNEPLPPYLMKASAKMLVG